MVGSAFSQGLKFEEQMYDFGHIGIDFKVQHTFIFENRTDVPVKILDLDVSCDCTSVNTVDTVVQPGDTAFFHLTFETKDYYGPINKSFTVTTDHPKMPELKYFYLSIIGQWFNGIKPDPISLFFLPGKKAQTITIPNTHFDEISVASLENSQEYVTSKIITEKAKRGSSVQVEIAPAEDLPAGTYYTTVGISIKTDDTEPVLLSIPTKIVRY